MPLLDINRAACGSCHRSTQALVASTSPRCEVKKLMPVHAKAPRGSNFRTQAAKPRLSGSASLSAAVAVGRPVPQVALPEYGALSSGAPVKWDIVGLGQAMVDFTASVDESILSGAPFNVPKGSRR